MVIPQYTLADGNRVHKEPIWHSEKIKAVCYLTRNSVVVLPVPNYCGTFTYIYLFFLKFNLFSEASSTEKTLVMFHCLLIKVYIFLHFMFLMHCLPNWPSDTHTITSHPVQLSQLDCFPLPIYIWCVSVVSLLFIFPTCYYCTHFSNPLFFIKCFFF